MDDELMYAEGEIASLDAQLATAHAEVAGLRAQTERLTAFVAAWREIETLYAKAERKTADGPRIDSYHYSQAVILKRRFAARFGIDAGDVRAAGRVISRLTEDQ